jgi:hypothetical protein
MKYLLMIKSWIKYKLLKLKLKKRHPVIQDLFDNDHDLCLNCGELFWKKTTRHKFCSKSCCRRYYYINEGK